MDASTTLIAVFLPWAVGTVYRSAKQGAPQGWLPWVCVWLGLAWSCAAIGLAAELVVGFGDVAKSLVPERKIAARALMVGQHWTLLPAALFTVLVAGAAVAGRARGTQTAETDASWRATWVAAAVGPLPVVMALMVLGAFYLGYMGLDPANVDTGSGLRASLVLIAALGFGWFAFLASSVYGAVRLVLAWRQAQSV